MKTKKEKGGERVLLARLQLAARRTWAYYQTHGFYPTARKAAVTTARILLRSAPVPAGSGGHPLAASVPFRSEDLKPVGPLDGSTTLVQEVYADAHYVDRVELLLATYGRKNTSQNEALMIDTQGNILHHQKFSSRSVGDNQFHTVLQLREPKALAGGRFFLVLRSRNGSPRNAVTMWRTDIRMNGLRRGGRLKDHELVACLRNAEPSSRLTLVPGTLVYRVFGRWTSNEARYRQPELPEKFQQSLIGETPRVLMVRALLSEPPRQEDAVVSTSLPARCPRWTWAVLTYCL